MTNLQVLIKQITDEVMQAMDTKCPIGGKCGGCKGDLHCASEKMTDVKDLIHLGACRIGAGLGIKNVPQDIASYIDHTLLKAETTPKEIKKLCEEAKQYHFASVCIQPCYVSLCASLLHGTHVKVCTVIGFPLGATSTLVKAYEAKLAEAEGAHEVDMVINIGALKSKGYDYVRDDIRAVVDAVSKHTVVKVILETALLNEEEKIKGCELAKQAQAHFVKTSTGFSSGGATASDIALMRQIVGECMGVKASGGIRDRQVAETMIKAGASRIGASASVKIVENKPDTKSSGY